MRGWHPARGAPRARRIRAVATLLLLGAGIVLGLGIFDRAVMPSVVRHGRDVTVPSLEGVTQGEARNILERNGLALGNRQEVPDPLVRVGQVVRQEPPAGTRVRMGRAVQILVSQGTPSRKVPPLVGKTMRVARIDLAQRGLSVGAVRSVEARGRQEGEILATRPPAGTLPLRDGEVDFLVAGAAHPQIFLMPDLRGSMRSEAARRLSAVEIRTDFSEVDGRVYDQDPRPGQPVRSGTSVRLGSAPTW